MFASQVTKDVVVQNESGEDVLVHIRKLSGRTLEKARMAQVLEQAKPLRAMGGEVMKSLATPEGSQAEVEAKAKRATMEGQRRARYDQHDRTTVLVAGIVSWSCPGVDMPKVSPSSIDDLIEETAQKLHEEIVDLSLPPIDAKEAEEQQAKG